MNAREYYLGVQVDTFPHHRHGREGEVHPAMEMDILQVLDAVLAFLPADG